MRGAIYGSVGRGGANHPHDVTSVQLLLNNARYGDDDALRVCGPRTLAAIDAYQRYRLHMPHADGLVQPGCQTIRDLLEISSVKNHSLIREVHQIQKVRSSRSYPTANVDDLAPHPPRLYSALKTPEAHVASSGQTGHKYTDSPMEVPRVGTAYDPLTLPDMLQKAWPELTKDGARMLTAQSMGETRKAKACWNYNLGNMKCSKAQRKVHLHQYLRGTWEYYSSSEAAENISRNKNSRYATPEEIRNDVGVEAAGKRVVVFIPPDIQCCFLAFRTLSEGILGWREYLIGRTQTHPDFVPSLNKRIVFKSLRLSNKLDIIVRAKTYTPGLWKRTSGIWMRF